MNADPLAADPSTIRDVAGTAWRFGWVGPKCDYVLVPPASGARFTPDDALAILRFIQQDTGDGETQHEVGDAVLCELLRSTGGDEVVDAFLSLTRWYG